MHPVRAHSIEKRTEEPTAPQNGTTFKPQFQAETDLERVIRRNMARVSAIVKEKHVTPVNSSMNLRLEVHSLRPQPRAALSSAFIPKPPTSISTPRLQLRTQRPPNAGSATNSKHAQISRPSPPPAAACARIVHEPAQTARGEFGFTEALCQLPSVPAAGTSRNESMPTAREETKAGGVAEGWTTTRHKRAETSNFKDSNKYYAKNFVVNQGGSKRVCKLLLSDLAPPSGGHVPLSRSAMHRMVGSGSTGNVAFVGARAEEKNGREKPPTMGIVQSTSRAGERLDRLNKKIQSLKRICLRAPVIRHIQ